MSGDFVLAGTGPRRLRVAARETQVQAFGWCLDRVVQRLDRYGPRLIVMSGGAEGLDECLARAAMRVHARLWLALPNGIHANKWRNLWMVDGGRGFPGADDFAVLGPVKPGSGTAHCVEAIKAVGKWRDDMVLGPDPLSPAPPLPIGTVDGSPVPAEAMDR